MKISELITELESIKAAHGDIPVQLQDDGKSARGCVISYEEFFVVPEHYLESEGGWLCNLRWWPY